MNTQTPEKTGKDLWTEIRRETIEALDSLKARQKMVKVLVDELEAMETKYFQHEGIVGDSRDVIAHTPRLKAVELLTQIYGLKAPEKHELKADVSLPMEQAVQIYRKFKAEKG